MSKLENNVVWITGASSGIGEACARAYAEQGATLILSARSTDKLEKLSSELSATSKVLTLDVADSAALAAKTQQAIHLFGQIDILINNAGISQRGLAIETDLEVDRKLFEVNYFGNIALTKAILPHMMERGSGNIVIISSVAGRLSTAGRSSYAATKHALFGFYDGLRAELSETGVHVNMICPGYIRTQISVNALDSKGKKHGIMDPNQDKGMSAEECARQILKAVSSNKREAYIGGKETKYVIIKRLYPALYHRLIAKMAREEKY